MVQTVIAPEGETNIEALVKIHNKYAIGKIIVNDIKHGFIYYYCSGRI